MDIIEEIKQRINIEDLVGEYVQLTRAGRNWRGLSPFNSEKTPSFIVSPEKQIWHDFSSGKGGNIYSFIMEMEGLDFKEALTLLANRVGLENELNKNSQKTRNDGIDKDRLYNLLELSTKFYQVQFKNNKIALEYIFKNRKFTKNIVLDWKFGYSPNSGHALKDFLVKKEFTLSEIKAAGLISSNSRSDNDMFRGRLMIPLQDQQGRIIGFTARILDNEVNIAKYINTPQTVLYDKSRHVFGLHLAKESIRKQNFVVIVEGNLDVVSSHQSGVLNVVATAGTAITSYHLKILSRFTSDIRLSFDSDKAGLEATERAIILASKLNINLSIVDIENSKDPDELIKKDPALWQDAIDRHVYALDWLIKRYLIVHDVKTAEGKKSFTNQILPIINKLQDEVEKEFYLNKISNIIDIDRKAINKKSQNYLADPMILKKNKINLDELNKSNQEYLKVEDKFICLVFLRPTLRELLKPLKKSIFIQDDSRNIYELLLKQPQFDFKKSKSLLAEFNISSDYVKIIILLYEELYQKFDLDSLYDEASFLRLRLVENYVKSQRDNIQEKLLSADDAQTEMLLKNVNNLNTFLNKIKRS